MEDLTPGSAPAVVEEPPVVTEPVVEAPVVEPEGGEAPPEAAAPPKPEPPVGSPRWNEIYRKTKEQERRIAELESAIVQRPPVQQQQADPATILDNLWTERREAAAAMDFAKQSDIDKKIRSVEMYVERQRQEQFVSTSTAQATMKQAIDQFEESTPWANTNGDDFKRPMQVYLADVIKRKQATWAGTFSGLLASARKEVEDEFSYKSPGTPTHKEPVTFVQGGNGSGVKPPVKTVSLTADERKMAETYFSGYPDPYKTYAEAKARTTGRQ
jgi:hypothetical protein